MARHFDYSDWSIDEVCDDLRRRIREARKPLPKKVMKHYVNLIYVTGVGCGLYTHSLYQHIQMSNPQTRKEYEDFLDNITWIERKSDNCWVEKGENQYYTDKSGNQVLYHYEIRESDHEVFEDDEFHYEYTEDEVNALIEALHTIRMGIGAMRAYDYCCDEGVFGKGSFITEYKENMDEAKAELKKWMDNIDVEDDEDCDDI